MASDEERARRSMGTPKWPLNRQAHNGPDPWDAPAPAMTQDTEAMGVELLSCMDCRTPVISWRAPNALWNLVMGGPEANDDPGGIVCPNCFLIRAEAAGISPAAWLVSDPTTPAVDGLEVVASAERVSDRYRINLSEAEIRSWAQDAVKVVRVLSTQVQRLTEENEALRGESRWPPDAQFHYGDWVEKFTGEARWEGRVVSAYHTKRLALRYVVEVEPQSFQMIAVPSQLRALSSTESHGK